MYGVVPPPPNVTVTLATNPGGLTVSVNGLGTVAPSTISAPAGTV